MIEHDFGENQDEEFYRVIIPEYAGKPRSGMSAARRGGCFNRAMLGTNRTI